MQDILERAKFVKLLILDVDGIMTDGRLYYDDSGKEVKSFNSLDGHGIKMLKENAIEVAIITGRSSTIVSKRAEELKIHHLYQGYSDKFSAYQELIQELAITADKIAYMGDDLPDLPVMSQVRLSITVPNAHFFVKELAHWQTAQKGGEGAVREVCDAILKSQGKLQAALSAYLNPSV